MTSFTSIEANRFIHQLIRLVLSVGEEKLLALMLVKPTHGEAQGFEKKFEDNLGKVKNGEEVTFFKPYDRKAFDLSKFVWSKFGLSCQIQW